MNARRLRVAAFVAALVAAFALAWGGGRAVGPIDTEPAPPHEAAADTGDDERDRATTGTPTAIGRRRRADRRAPDGYTLDLADRTLAEPAAPARLPGPDLRRPRRSSTTRESTRRTCTSSSYAVT